MLIKKELENIPVSNFPDTPKDEKRNYVYTTSACIANLPRCGRILTVDVFMIKDKSLQLRFFSDGKGFLCCREWPAKVWLKRMPGRLLSTYGGSFSVEEDEKLVRGFFEGKEPHQYRYSWCVLDQINSFVHEIYSEAQQRKMDRKYEKMQEHFAMYPDYPADLKTYCENHVFGQSYIFIDKLVKNKRRGVCGFCGKAVSLGREVKPGDNGVCPRCGKAVKYRGSWVNSPIIEKAQICIAHNVGNQLLLRWTEVQRLFPSGSSKYNYSFEDYYYNLHLNTPKGKIIYSYAFQSQMGWGWAWFRKDNGTVNYKRTFVYAANLREVFGDKYYHVDLQAGLEGAREIDFARLLDNLKSLPAAEYLFKMGLTTLASEVTEHTLQKGRGFEEVMGVNRQYLPLYRRFNIGMQEHHIVEAASVHRSWISEDSFSHFRKLNATRHDVGDIISLLDNMSFDRFTNYFTKQLSQSPMNRRKLSYSLTLYKDYIDMARSMNVDLSRKSIRFPQNIKEAHDRILAQFNLVKHEIEDKNFAAATEQLYAGMKEYRNKEFCIVFPSLRSDFITEGQSLNHCVGSDSYYKRHLEGIRMIFFVRKISEPSKPYFTMELDIRELRIVQLYGFGGCSAPPPVRKFADEFLNKLRPRAAERKVS